MWGHLLLCAAAACLAVLLSSLMEIWNTSTDPQHRQFMAIEKDDLLVTNLEGTEWSLAQLEFMSLIDTSIYMAASGTNRSKLTRDKLTPHLSDLSLSAHSLQKGEENNLLCRNAAALAMRVPDHSIVYLPYKQFYS
uniref:Uncharacterized protein n=1 Tax=Oryza meridionalis TaxID=40149 RepID=A0A0E0EIT0_9ORYZ